MYFPPVFEILSGIIPHWMIKRAVLVATLGAVVYIGGGLAWLVRDALNSRIAQVLYAATLFTGALIVYRPEIRIYLDERAEHQGHLQRSLDLREALLPIVSDRPLIAANQNMSNLIPASVVATVMSPRTGAMNPADPEGERRRDDGIELLAPETDQARRLEINRRYAIDFVLLSDRERETVGGFMGRLGELTARGPWFDVYRIAPGADPLNRGSQRGM